MKRWRIGRLVLLAVTAAVLAHVARSVTTSLVRNTARLFAVFESESVLPEGILGELWEEVLFGIAVALILDLFVFPIVVKGYRRWKLVRVSVEIPERLYGDRCVDLVLRSAPQRRTGAKCGNFTRIGLAHRQRGWV